MTSANARIVANVVLASAGVAAAYVILTTPSLRRLAVRGVQLWLGASVPGYLFNETRHAWVASGRAGLRA
jgi:frataxin-like iron-binding protein CyaY